MGGGPRNPEHQARFKALKKARKAANKLLPPKPPKVERVSTQVYDDLVEWKDKPISEKIAHRVPHMEAFIKDMWLAAYPLGASIRKLQRDIAFRMERQYRPGKLPYQVLMPIVGNLERQGYLRTRMSSDGKCLIYTGPEVKSGEDISATLTISRKKVRKTAPATATPDNSYNNNTDEEGGSTDSNEPSAVTTRRREPYKPKFSKQQKPKVHKIKRGKKNDSAPGHDREGKVQPLPDKLWNATGKKLNT